MKRRTSLLNLTAAVALLATAVAGTASADTRTLAGRDETKPNLVRVPREVSKPTAVDVWTSAGEGGVMVPGQSVKVYFQSRRDAYVTIVDIDTRGRATVLFPESPYDDGFVYGGETVSLPGRGAPYKLQVTGPAGVERIIALASDEPIRGRWREMVAQDAAYDSRTLGLNEALRESDVVWNASVTTTVGDTRIRAEAGTAPQLIRTPVERVPRWDLRVVRDETWFQVRPGWFRRH
jgi:hypothetical protein